jgi:lipopolysaccharide transport system permease protein
MSSNVLQPDSMNEKRAARETEARRVKVIRAPSLSPAGVATGLRSLLEYSDLLYTLSLHRIKVRYKQSVLGIAWAIVQPVSLMLIYTLIFSLIAKVQTDGLPYAVFAYTALLPWTFFATSLSNATSSLVTHSELVTKVYFPREILPLTYVIAALFDFLIATTVLAGLFFYYRVHLTVNALWAVPIILVLALFAAAVVLISSATQVRFRDIGVAMPLLLQLWMFATPVVYPLSAVPAWLRPAYMLNPMVGVIENFRRVLLMGLEPDLRSLGISALVSIILLAVGYVYFKRVEATVADII